MVPLEHDTVDDGVFLQAHQKDVAITPQRYVLEQAGGVKGLERAVQIILTERVPHTCNHVGQHGVGFDTGVTRYPDIFNISARRRNR